MGLEELNPDLLRKIFRQRLIDETTGCWLWTGGVTWNGHAQLNWGGRGKSQAVARWIMGIAPGDQVHVLHKLECSNPRCFNPSHLYLGNVQDNTLDTVRLGTHFNASKTHCPQGHEYTAENTLYEERGRGRVSRRCKTCRLNRSKKWRS